MPFINSFVWKLLLVFTFLISSKSVRAEAVKGLENPRATIETHLLNLRSGLLYQPQLAAVVIPPNSGRSVAEREELAIKLKQIFLGKGILINTHIIPDEPNYVSSKNKENVYFLDSLNFDVYLEKIGDSWYYSEHTVELIPEMHKKVFAFKTDVLVSFLSGKNGAEKFFSLYPWQYLGALLLLVASFVGFRLFHFVFHKILMLLIIKMGYGTIPKSSISPIAKLMSLLLVFSLLRVFLPVLLLPTNLSYYLLLFTKASIPLFVTLVFYNLINVVSAYLRKIAQEHDSGIDDQLIPLIQKTLKVFVLIIGTLFILQNLDFNVTALLAGISIGGLAVALAAQDTIKNFFGSIMIFIDRPFHVGDWIIGQDIDGKVEEVGFRSTRVRTFHNSVTYVPNGKIADMTLDNMGKREYRRYTTNLALTYDTPTHLLEAFIEGLKKITLAHPATRKDYYNIYFHTFNSHSIDVLYYIFIKAPDWPGELKVRHELNLSIKRLALEIGVQFAFPTQTLHVQDFPGKTSLNPVYESEEEVKKRVTAFKP